MRLIDTALVTGANRGLGLAFVEELVDRGARRVWAAARNVADCAPLVERFGDTVCPVTLDLADPASIEAAAAAVFGVDLIVSNAGVSMIAPFLDQAEADQRRMFEINVWGPQRLIRALLPQLREGRGGVLYVLSMASLLPALSAEGYSASKAAAMMMGHGMRHALMGDGVGVTLSYPGFIDTDLGRNFDVPRAPPRLVAARAIDDWQAGLTSSFPDVFSRMTRDALCERMDRVLTEPGKLLEEMVVDFMGRSDAGQ